MEDAVMQKLHQSDGLGRKTRQQGLTVAPAVGAGVFGCDVVEVAKQIQSHGSTCTPPAKGTVTARVGIV